MCAPVLNHFIAVFQTSTWHEIKDANFQDCSIHFQELITDLYHFFFLKSKGRILYIYFFMEYSTSASEIVVILVCNTIRSVHA